MPKLFQILFLIITVATGSLFAQSGEVAVTFDDLPATREAENQANNADN